METKMQIFEVKTAQGKIVRYGIKEGIYFVENYGAQGKSFQPCWQRMASIPVKHLKQIKKISDTTRIEVIERSK